MVVLATISWLTLWNHCALSMAMIDRLGSETVAAHGCCTGRPPAHQAPAKESSLPCCKVLRVVAVTSAEAPAWNAVDFRTIAIEPIAAAVALLRPASVASSFLDIGPPPCRTFAEAVLQRSLPAHAPPSLADV